ncbi:MAG TPA: X-Pro dipeptidyl-peptidase [Prolixibacteraceae bacterium]|nr:X-Pro dipeptidyl-peptidase [Prolixibacteraceae bacterium]
MKRIIIWLLLITPFFTKAENADSTWIVNNYIKKEQYITMRDGIRLYTVIYLPKDITEKHPVLITRTPYSSGPYGENNFRKFWNNHYKEYFRENYIMVMQDVRGKSMSEGTFIDVRPFNKHKKLNTDIDESTDTYDTIDWLVKNLAGNNRKVGVFGNSYPGFYAIQAALCNHPALVAVSPQAPVTDWFMGDDWHHNGAFFILDAFNFFVIWGFGNIRKEPTEDEFKSNLKVPTKDNYAFFLRTGAIPNFTKLTGDSIKFWNEMMNHPDYDAWWQERNARTACYNIKPAMLVVGGLFDAEDCFGAWNTYKAIEKQSPRTDNKLVMGPWCHGQWTRTDGTHLGHIKFGSNTVEWYARNMEIPFFNYYLKKKGSVENIKNANVFFTGENIWKQFTQWPPADATEKALFLQSGGKLNWEKSTSRKKSYSEYISDPAKPVPYTEGINSRRTYEYLTDDQRFASTRPDVLVFQTDVLTKDVTLAGPVIADLQTSISTTDADFVVKLIDVFPDDFRYGKDDNYIMSGYEMLVRGDIFRGRYRRNFEKPEAFTADKITQVKYSMPDVAHTFKKGHRIMVQVQSSWFPLSDRNPQKFTDIYHAKDVDFQKATIRIYHDQINNSKIILSVKE